jgi:hypothetical protein
MVVMVGKIEVIRLQREDAYTKNVEINLATAR